MHRLIFPFILLCAVKFCSGQQITKNDLHGNWYLEQQLLDSIVMFDANNETSFAKPSLAEIERIQALSPVPIDTSAIYASIHQNFENLRRYQLQFTSDSTYLTVFASGMAKPLPAPEKGRYELSTADGKLELFAPGYSATGAVRIRADTLYLNFDGPFLTGLVFRRQLP